LESDDRTEDENNNQKQEDEGHEEVARKMTRDAKIRNVKCTKSDSTRLKSPLWVLKHRFVDQDSQPFKLVEIAEETHSFEKEFE
jgi:hypothetical protein